MSRSFEGGLTSQATTSQRVTVLGGHPAYNDNRVEIEPAELP